VKRALLSPAAKQDRRDELRYYRTEAGTRVAQRLVDALKKALNTLEQQPAMGSPDLGNDLGIEGLRAWRLDGFPLSLWYFERADHVLIVRVIGQRQEAEFVAVVRD
jgi:toxin ParE1/3/4